MTVVKLNKSIKTKIKELLNKKEEIKGTYFSNGDMAMNFESNYCDDCLNYRDNGNGYGCAIMDMFFCYQDEMNNGMRNILIDNFSCNMYLTIDKAKIKGDLILSKENDRLKQENINLKNGYNQLNLLESEAK